MIAEPKLKIVNELIANSTKEELIWINGYLSGLVTHSALPASPAKLAVDKITLVYGSETGNSKKLAGRLASKAKGTGLKVKLISLDQYRFSDIVKEEYFFAVISTQGEGEPPASAKKFFDHLHTGNLALSSLKYGILALGDTSYPLFCKAGEDIDTQLEKLGGIRALPLVRCDTDYDADADLWLESLLQSLSEHSDRIVKEPAPKKRSGKQYYQGKILSNINLNDIGSNKTTHHIEIEVEDVEYQPGDCLGMIPSNSLPLVEQIIEVLDADPATKFFYREEERSLTDLLTNSLNICHLPARVVHNYGLLVQQEIPATSISLLDLLKIYPLTDSSQTAELIGILEPITPRLYSISSSPEAHDGEIHLTVAHNRFCVGEEWRNGLCSDFLVNAEEGSVFSFYIHKNNHFRLPEDNRDVIMIGPGTGIAPFRSFIAHRDAVGASGRNWLFFGEQQFSSDFLYQTEIQAWFETGVLSKVNTAFSRDQQEKIYVQHRMQQHRKELLNWIKDGAHIYVCGTKDPMSADVEKTLLEIFQTEGNYSPEDAVRQLDALKAEDRFLLDVY